MHDRSSAGSEDMLAEEWTDVPLLELASTVVRK